MFRSLSLSAGVLLCLTLTISPTQAKDDTGGASSWWKSLWASPEQTQGNLPQPLSVYLGKTAPKPAPAIQWKPWKDGAEKTPEFWVYVNFLLPLTTPNPQDKQVLDKMAKIGLGANAEKPSLEIQAAMQQGMQDALAELKKASTHITDPSLFFRSRKDTNKDYFDRALGVMVGIFGNVKKVSVYFATAKDDKGELFDGSKHNYTVTFTTDQIPPAKNFWSFTMYKLPQRWLVDNPKDPKFRATLVHAASWTA